MPWALPPASRHEAETVPVERDQYRQKRRMRGRGRTHQPSDSSAVDALISICGECLANRGGGLFIDRLVAGR